jgi:hypothetical protein
MFSNTSKANPIDESVLHIDMKLGWLFCSTIQTRLDKEESVTERLFIALDQLRQILLG